MLQTIFSYINKSIVSKRVRSRALSKRLINTTERFCDDENGGEKAACTRHAGNFKRLTVKSPSGVDFQK